MQAKHVRMILTWETLTADRVAPINQAAKEWETWPVVIAITLYYEKIAQHPEVAKDANAPKFLSVMEDETTTALVGEVAKDLAADVRRVARARRWWPLRLTWTSATVRYALRRQDDVPTTKMEREIEQMIDRVLPQMMNALRIAAVS